MSAWLKKCYNFLKTDPMCSSYPHDKEQFLFPSKCLINISCWIVSDCKLLETKAWISLIFIFPRAPLIELHANPRQSDECPIHGDLLEWDLRHLLYLLWQF